MSAGMAFGGVWGLAEGLKHSEGRTYRLRMNSILNGCARRGPFLSNNLAVLGKQISGRGRYLVTKRSAKAAHRSVESRYC